MYRLLLTLALLVASSGVDAARLSSDSEATAVCMRDAAARFSVPELALWVILDVEAGTVGKTTPNSNGTYDIGPMQINSWWLPRLAQRGITEDMVLNNLCMNVSVAAWIFAQELNRHRDLTKALAHYHSPTAHHQRRYLGLIVNAIDRRISRLRREGGVATR
ncbi:lytic transglycosylase domain-containing protein [Luteimonas sp. MHLX1A]|nr:lytic transglycosylase domain-containing protein [Luteimonas sp. MHLX1A]